LALFWGVKTAPSAASREKSAIPSQARNQSVPSGWVRKLLDLIALDVAVRKRRSDLANQQIS